MDSPAVITEELGIQKELTVSLWLLLNSRLGPLTFCLSHSLRNTHTQTLGKTSSLTARSIALDSVRRAMWVGVWGNELSSAWVSFAKLESETQNVIQGNAFMYLRSLTLEKLEILTRNDWNLAVTTFFLVSSNDCFIYSWSQCIL